MALKFNRDDDYDDEDEVDFILFQGALNGAEVDLRENAKLAEAGLVPAKELVTDALLRRADRLRVEPKGKVSIVSLFIDGKAYPGGRMSRQQGLAVTQMLKLLAGLDIRERNKKQAGGIKAELEETRYELHVEIAPLGEGAERLTVTARNLKVQLDSPEDLGFTDNMKSLIRDKTSEKRGLLLVCGPPYSGVTTTTYAVVRTVDAYIYTIFTLADSGGRDLGHVTRFKANPADSLEDSLVRASRMECDVLLFDPLRDLATVKTLFENQDKMCYVAEFAAKDAAHGVAQLIKWLGGPKPVCDGLQLLISQKLIRTLCNDCKEAYRPNPKLLAKIGLPPETRVLYRPPQPDPDDEDYDPCATCGETGYLGRAGMFEVLEMTDEMQQFLAQNPPPQAIKQQARRLKMQTLQQEGLRLVAEGRTSLEELQRAFSPDSE